MSASIYWRPVDTSYKYLSIAHTSSFISSIEEVFGGLPRKLDANDIDKLQAMSAVCSEDNDPYYQLVEIINDVGMVEIGAEY